MPCLAGLPVGCAGGVVGFFDDVPGADIAPPPGVAGGRGWVLPCASAEPAPKTQPRATIKMGFMGDLHCAA